MFTFVFNRRFIISYTDTQLNYLIIAIFLLMLEIVLLDKAQIVSQRRSTTFSRVARASLRKPLLRPSFLNTHISMITAVMVSGNCLKPIISVFRNKLCKCSEESPLCPAQKPRASVWEPEGAAPVFDGGEPAALSRLFDKGRAPVGAQGWPRGDCRCPP